MHLYHYCTLSPNEGDSQYHSGTMMKKDKVKTNADYVKFTEELAEHLSVEKKSFVLLSLNYLA